MADESSPQGVPQLDAHDLAAVKGLLIRVMRSDDANRDDRIRVAEMTKAINDRNIERNRYIAALSAFGFDMNGPDVWTRFKEAVGQEFYSAANSIARPQLNVPAPPQKTVYDQADREGVAEDVEIDEGPEEAEQEVPKVREAILSYLRSLPSNEGAQVPTIKEYLTTTFGLETHEKTPGMTLYRLSKDGLVKREGRTWFSVPMAPESKTEISSLLAGQ